MEQDVLKALAQLKILLKKEKGFQLDLEKFVHDAAYGRQILALAEDSSNESLVFIAISIRDKLGYLKPVAAPEPATVEHAEAGGKKYMFGARS